MLKNETLIFQNLDLPLYSLQEEAVNMLNFNNPLMAFTLSNYIIETTNQIIFDDVLGRPLSKEEVLTSINTFFNNFFEGSKNKQLKKYTIPLLRLVHQILTANYDAITNQDKSATEAGITVKKLNIRENQYEVTAKKALAGDFLTTGETLMITQDLITAGEEDTEEVTTTANAGV